MTQKALRVRNYLSHMLEAIQRIDRYTHLLSSEVDSSPDFVEPRFCRQKWASKSFWAPKFERFAKIIRALPWSDPEGALTPDQVRGDVFGSSRPE
jgi:hypothetical protein